MGTAISQNGKLIGSFSPLCVLSGGIKGTDTLHGSISLSVGYIGCLIGAISGQKGLKGSISEQGRLTGSLSMPIGYEDYTGEYEILPQVTDQTVETNDKRMTDNLKVLAIPYYEVSNASGGNTLNIG